MDNEGRKFFHVAATFSKLEAFKRIPNLNKWNLKTEDVQNVIKHRK
jgi:hypothetical protein